MPTSEESGQHVCQCINLFSIIKIVEEVPGSTKNAEAEQKGDHCLDDEEEEDEDSIVLPPLETRISVETIEKRNELLKEKYSELNEEPIKKAFVDEVEDQTKERDEAKVDDNKFGRNSENQVEVGFPLHISNDKLNLCEITSCVLTRKAAIIFKKIFFFEDGRNSSHTFFASLQLAVRQ